MIRDLMYIELKKGYPDDRFPVERVNKLLNGKG